MTNIYQCCRSIESHAGWCITYNQEPQEQVGVLSPICKIGDIVIFSIIDHDGSELIMQGTIVYAGYNKESGWSYEVKPDMALGQVHEITNVNIMKVL